MGGKGTLFLKKICIYLFMAGPGLQRCSRAFSSCSGQELLLAAVREVTLFKKKKLSGWIRNINRNWYSHPSLQISSVVKFRNKNMCCSGRTAHKAFVFSVKHLKACSDRN